MLSPLSHVVCDCVCCCCCCSDPDTTGEVPADFNFVARGEYCLAQYSVDDRWYRGLVEAIEPEATEEVRNVHLRFY